MYFHTMWYLHGSKSESHVISWIFLELFFAKFIIIKIILYGTFVYIALNILKESIMSLLRIVTSHAKMYTNGFPLNGWNARLPNGLLTVGRQFFGGAVLHFFQTFNLIHSLEWLFYTFTYPGLFSLDFANLIFMKFTILKKSQNFLWPKIRTLES